MKTPHLLPLLLWGACSMPPSTPGSALEPGESLEADTDTDTDTDTDADTDADEDEIPDPAEGLRADPSCDAVSGVHIAGATGYFVGAYRLDPSGEVSGEERWVLFANETWRAAGGSDCEVVWEVTGQQGSATGACAACDYSLAVDASADLSQSTCAAALFEDALGFSATYNVQVVDGQADFFFGSGALLGTGVATEAYATYASEATCLFF